METIADIFAGAAGGLVACLIILWFLNVIGPELVVLVSIALLAMIFLGALLPDNEQAAAQPAAETVVHKSDSLLSPLRRLFSQKQAEEAVAIETAVTSQVSVPLPSARPRGHPLKHWRSPEHRPLPPIVTKG